MIIPSILSSLFHRVSNRWLVIACLCLPIPFSAHGTMVINEILYAPVDRTKPTQFIELLNAGGQSEDLSGWEFTDAVQYVFPPNTVVASGGLVVVAADPVIFAGVYGFTPLGPWSGALKRGGANIQLRDKQHQLIDEVHYQAGFPWPTHAHGDGSSIELINPSLDNNLGGSWRSSGATNYTPNSVVYIPFQDTQWRFRKGTSEASDPTNAWRQIEFREDDSWLTAQTSIGFGDNDDKTDLSKDPWDLPFPMQTNYISLYLRHAFVIPEGKVPTQLHLRVIIEDGCVLWVNGHEVNPRLHMKDKLEKPFNAGVPGGVNGAITHRALSGGKPVIENVFISAVAAELHAGTNMLAIHAFNSTLTGTGVTVDCSAIGEVAQATPGKQNAAFSSVPPPVIRQVAHDPAQPAHGVPVQITAKITDAAGIAGASLSYQVVEPGSYIRQADPSYATNWISIAMKDDGSGGDATSGDGIFTVTMDPSIQVHRRLIRYRISATNTLGSSITVPYDDDPSPNFAYFVYDGVPGWSGAFRPGATGPQGVVQSFPPSLMNSLPVYHLIANETDVIRSQYDNTYDGVAMPGTLVYEGVVYDHINFYNRGEFSTYVSGKNKWRVRLNNTHELQARDNYGRAFDQTWSEFNMNGGSCPWIAANRGMGGIEECISFRMYELLGVPSPSTHYISLRVIDNAVEAADPTATVKDATFPGNGLGQYSGDLWGLYLVTESPGGSFLDERGLPDGNVYKIEGGGSGTGNKKHQSATQPTSTLDWDRFASSSSTSQKESWWRTNLDMSAYYNFRLGSRIVGNVDMRNGWNHYFYHNTNGLWSPIPWDLDMMFVGRTHQSASGAITQDNSMSVTNLAIEKRNRARELLDLMVSDVSTNGGQVGQLVDEYAQIVHPKGQAQTWVDVDAAMWNFHPRTAGSPTEHSDSNHKGNFFYTPHTFNAIGGPYKRWLRSTNYVGTAAHEDFVQYLTDYMSDTYPGPKAWSIGNGQQLGYGYEFLKSEAKENVTSDVPDRPTIQYTGPAGFPANDLKFHCSNFSGKQFAAVQWRLGWIAAPGLAGYSGGPRKYEVEPYWTSEEFPTMNADIQIPISVAKPGLTYRARVRHKDANGRWSRWSDAVQFVCSSADVAVYRDSLVISEIMYHPKPATSAELAAGFGDEDFEYLEIKNTSAYSVDLSDVGFTTGVRFQFTPGASLAPGAFALVVKNQAAFEKRYGSGKPVFGNYGTDNLKNSGELLTLSYGSNTPIRTVFYKDIAPWPTDADGTGKSLELKSPNSRPDHELPENWRASVSPLGTPGGEDGLTFASWAGTHGGVTDPAADPDHDGLINFLEYAFVGDPLQASESTSPKVEIRHLSAPVPEGDYLTIRYRGRTDAADLGYHVEVSEDLLLWKETALLVSTEPQGDGTATFLWRLPKPIPGVKSSFVRVRVSD